RTYRGWAETIHGNAIDADLEFLNYTRHEPISVCGQIVQWNFPLLIWSWRTQ
ncbi:hypothetical protein EDB80DRAFT_594282, partial [Ilyonectria destructans]